MLTVLLPSCGKEDGNSHTESTKPDNTGNKAANEVSVTIYTAWDFEKDAWKEGETVVVNGLTSNPLQNIEGAKATFTFAADLTAPYSVLSPVEAYKGENRIFLPADCGYQVCAGQGDAPYLKPITGVFRVLATGSEQDVYLAGPVVSVELRSNDGTQICGEFELDYRYGLFKNTSEDEVSKVLSCAKGEEQTIDFHLPARNYKGGFTVTYYDTKGNSHDFVYEEPIKIEAGKVVEGPDFLSGAIDNGRSRMVTINVKSTAMNKNIPVNVITPDCYEVGLAFPVLYLLHGFSDNNTTWSKGGHIENFANKYNLVVVMPDGGYSSWYFDSPIDPTYKYETFIVKELVPYIDSQYKTIPDRSQRAITGNSMGGHGAFYLTIRNQDVFGNVGAASGGVDFRPFPDNWDIKKRLGTITEYPQNWENHTVINMVDRIKPGTLNIFFDCGTSDYFYEVNCNLHDKLTALGIEHTFLTPPGAHSWDYWFANIEYQISFFSENFKASRK